MANYKSESYILLWEMPLRRGPREEALQVSKTGDVDEITMPHSIDVNTPLT